jgi:hypothetical protein
MRHFWMNTRRIGLALALPCCAALGMVSTGWTTTPAAAASAPNPCHLLTKSQVQAVLKQTVTKVQHQDEICTFKTTPVNGGPGNFVSLTLVNPYSASDFHSDYQTAARRAYYKSVSGIGNQAVFRSSQSEIDARKGNTLVSMDVGVLNPQGLSTPQPLSTLAPLARSALSKL